MLFSLHSFQSLILKSSDPNILVLVPIPIFDYSFPQIHSLWPPQISSSNSYPPTTDPSPHPSPAPSQASSHIPFVFPPYQSSISHNPSWQFQNSSSTTPIPPISSSSYPHPSEPSSTFPTNSSSTTLNSDPKSICHSPTVSISQSNFHSPPSIYSYQYSRHYSLYI